MVNLAEAMRFANHAADGAGKIALEHFRSDFTLEYKADDSPVTMVDQGIEAFLRSRISEAWPDHGIYGEEEAPEHIDREHVWVVDPIDGTKSFISGHPLFGGLIALLRDGEPCLGQIDIPATAERWCGVEGQPTTLNGTPCHTSSCRDLSRAFVYTTDPLLFSDQKGGVLEMLRDKARMLRFGGDCYNYALLASGHCDLVLETRLAPYDYLPLVQIVRGAGGVISDWRGRPLGIDSNGDVLASATPELHEQMLAELAKLPIHQAA